MGSVSEVRIWADSARKEYRIYVTALDGRQGCYYVTGNHWHPAKSTDGNLTAEEWAEARRLSINGGKWHNITADYRDGSKPQVDKPLPAPRVNKRAEFCALCGHMAKAGEAYIWQDQDTDEWLVAHSDADVCKRNRAESQAAKVAKEAADAALKVESHDLTVRVAMETGLPLERDWSWDDYSYRVGPILVETEHFTAREYTRVGELIGFVIEKKGSS